MAVREYHVGLGANGTWHIQREEAERPFAYYGAKDAAESAARVLAHLNEGIVVVHEKGGLVRRTDYKGQALAAN